MLRLTGLPSAARFPRATVRRGRDRFELVFEGDGDSTLIDVDLRFLGPGDDPESVELNLLGELQRMGYDVTRLEPEGEEADGSES